MKKVKWDSCASSNMWIAFRKEEDTIVASTEMEMEIGKGWTCCQRVTAEPPSTKNWRPLASHLTNSNLYPGCWSLTRLVVAVTAAGEPLMLLISPWDAILPQQQRVPRELELTDLTWPEMTFSFFLYLWKLRGAWWGERRRLRATRREGKTRNADA